MDRQREMPNPVSHIHWIILCLFFLSSACGFYLFAPSIRARYLFHELQTLQLGYSSFEDAKRLAKKINAKPNDGCNPSACTWDVRLNNGHLPRWWRGNGEVFAITFSIKDSVLRRKYVGFGTGTDTSFTPSHVSLEEQEHWGRGNTREPVQAGWYTTEKFRYYWFQIRMTPKASAEDRQRYTAFNYSCLWKYKGCEDARGLLPTANPLVPGQ
jgi:hypothetical protein